MKQVCSENICTGCCACVDQCQFDAISLKLNSEGFIISKIDQSLCTDCGLCKNVCPALNRGNSHENDEFKAFRCWSINDEDRINSSSGGIFPVLARWAIENGGVVVGAAFNERMELQHIEAEVLEDLEPLRGSKYIGSDASGMYNRTKELLEDGRLVLFTGTPCQNQALLLFLNKEYDNLYTCDFICHGVGSTKLFTDYLDEIQKKYDAKPQSISFRKKRLDYIRPSFEVKFDNGETFEKLYSSTFFGYYFMNSTCNRISCADCKFATINRISDFTLADYGCKDKYKFSQKELKKGISLIMVNSEKADQLFNSLSDKIEYSQCSLNDVLEASNSQRLTGKCYSSKDKDDFFKDFSNMNFPEFYNKWNSKIPSNFEKQIQYSGKITGNPIQIIYKIKNRFVNKILK